MKSDGKEVLRNLLAPHLKDDSTGIFKNAFDAAVKSNLSNYETIKQTVPAQNLLTIYSRRSKLKDSPAKGFDSLLASLKAARAAQIQIHSYVVDGHEYLIFTDPETTHLYGLLIVDVISQTQSGWLDKNGKWKHKPG